MTSLRDKYAVEIVGAAGGRRRPRRAGGSACRRRARRATARRDRAAAAAELTRAWGAKISPLAPASYPDVPALAGVRLATAEAGIRYREPHRPASDPLRPGGGRRRRVHDVALRLRAGRVGPRAPRRRPRPRARRQFRQRQRLHRHEGPRRRPRERRGGRRGCSAAASTRCSSPRPASSASRSTRRLSPTHLGRLAAEAAPGRFLDAARAIMTTDTFPKVGDAARAGRRRRGRAERHRQGRRHDRAGHGDHALLHLHRRADRAGRPAGCALSDAVAGSFNAVTIDGDTSTSDTVLAFATGDGRLARRAEPRVRSGRRSPRSAQASPTLCLDLAHQVVRDGEGATKFVEVTVSGATSDASAKRIAASIANSPLVKTALAGEDANWGRVVMAVGKAGEPADRDRLSIWFGDHRVAFQGERDPAYSEAGGLRLHEEQRARDPRRSRPRLRAGDDVDLRPDGGIRRHQRRLPKLRAQLADAAAPARRRLCADRPRQARADRPAAAGQAHGGPVGISRRQGGGGRSSGGYDHPRAGRGAGALRLPNRASHL